MLVSWFLNGVHAQLPIQIRAGQCNRSLGGSFRVRFLPHKTLRIKLHAVNFLAHTGHMQVGAVHLLARKLKRYIPHGPEIHHDAVPATHAPSSIGLLLGEPM
jgi:hypothetical protein